MPRTGSTLSRGALSAAPTTSRTCRPGWRTSTPRAPPTATAARRERHRPDAGHDPRCRNPQRLHWARAGEDVRIEAGFLTVLVLSGLMPRIFMADWKSVG